MWVFDRKKGKGRGKGCWIGTAQRWVLAKRSIQRANEWTHVRYFPTQWQLYSVSTLPTFPLALSGWIIGHVGHVLREQLPRNLFRKLRSLHSFFFFLNKWGSKWAPSDVHVKLQHLGSSVSESWLCFVICRPLRKTLGSHIGPQISAWLWHIHAYEPYYKHM